MMAARSWWPTPTGSTPAGASASLAVVRAGDALAGRPALAGLLPAGLFPREMAVAPSGRTLLVTCFGSGQLELVSLTGLP